MPAAATEPEMAGVFEIVLGMGAAIALLAYGFAIGRYKAWPFRLVSARFQRTPPENRHHRPRAEQFGFFQPEVDTVMLGDSMIEGGLWSDIFPGHRIANRGVGGDTTRRVLDRLHQVEPLRPKRVFLLVGLNDLARKVPVAQTLRNYAEIVTRLQAMAAEVIILSVVRPRDNPPLAAPVRQLNAELRKIASEHGCTFVDLDAALSDANGIRPENTYDGTHIGARGFVVFRDVIAPLIEGEPKPALAAAG